MIWIFETGDLNNFIGRINRTFVSIDQGQNSSYIEVIVRQTMLQRENTSKRSCPQIVNTSGPNPCLVFSSNAVHAGYDQTLN